MSNASPMIKKHMGGKNVLKIVKGKASNAKFCPFPK